MNDMDRIQREIAEHERWLAEVCPRSDEFDGSRVRRAVEIVVQEQWLARCETATMDRAALARIKSAVRVELAAARRKRHPWGWVAGTLSAAAMIAVAVFTAELPREAPVANFANTGDGTTVSLVAAFGTLDEWDNALDTEISNLREALGAVDGSSTAGEDGETWESDWESWGNDGSSGT